MAFLETPVMLPVPYESNTILEEPFAFFHDPVPPQMWHPINPNDNKRLDAIEQRLNDLASLFEDLIAALKSKPTKKRYGSKAQDNDRD